ncbi:MAG: nucleotidyltransferase domain-containing protein [Phycisphaerae bacterium]
MIAAIDEQRETLETLCRRHRVRRLEVFGSAADGTFDSQRSDVDFLVEYFPLSPGEYYEAYFGLLESLEALFERRVDLVDATCLKNPYFIQGVNESRSVVYETQPEKISG